MVDGSFACCAVFRTIACAAEADSDAMGKTPQSRLEIIGLDGHSGQCQESARVVAIREKGISILKEGHRPNVFFPLQQTFPGTTSGAAVKLNIAIHVRLAGFNHGREKDRAPNLATVNR